MPGDSNGLGTRSQACERESNKMSLYCKVLGILNSQTLPESTSCSGTHWAHGTHKHRAHTNTQQKTYFGLQHITKNKERRDTHPRFLHSCKENGTVPSNCSKVNFILMIFLIMWSCPLYTWFRTYVAQNLSVFSFARHRQSQLQQVAQLQQQKQLWQQRNQSWDCRPLLVLGRPHCAWCEEKQLCS